MTPEPDAELARYWAAVLAGDEATAVRLALRMLVEHPLPEVLDRLVVAAQRRVGEHWATNEWGVPQEHAATALNEAVVAALARTVPEPAPGPLLLVACVEREWHSLPARVVTETLRAHGLPTVDLGASASPDALISQVVDRGPRAVLLSASLSSSLARTRRLVEAVRGTGTPVVVGGRAFDPDGVRARRLGATAYAGSPGEVRDVLATLPRHVDAAPPLRHPGAREARSVQASDERVAADVVAALAGGPFAGPAQAPPDHWWRVLTSYVPHVVDALAGALLVEDVTVLTEAEDWLAGVLARRGAPAGVPQALRVALQERLVEFPEASALLASS